MLFTEFCVLHEANVTWLPQAVEHNGISPPRTSRSISALSVVHSTTRFAQFAVIVLALFCAMPAAIAAESVVIFVDGIAMSATGITAMEILTGPQPVRASNYLEESALPALIRLTAPTQQRILWNGNLTDAQATRTAVNNLEAMICQQRGNHVDLVTHSLGTVIAYTALAELAGIPGTDRKAACESTQISTFVTMGSPLGLEDALPERLGKLSGIAIPPLNKIASARQLRIMGRWLNVYASGDPIGGKIDLPSVVNVSFSLDQSTLTPRDAHSFPYKDADSVRMIADVIIGVHTRLGSATAGTASEVASKEKTAGECKEPVVKAGLSGSDAGLALGPAKDYYRADAIEALVKGEKFRVPQCGAELGIALTGATGEHRARAIKALVPVIKSNLSGEEGAAILGTSKECSEYYRADAVTHLARGKKFKADLSGKELEMILDGTTGEHRARAIGAFSAK